MDGASPEGFPRPYGKYELLGRLGDGGMAEVFLASRPGVAGFRQTVVIKRILPHLARKKRFVEMFIDEARLAAEVRHRNVVQVHELGTVGHELFMVMEYVQGTDLRVLLGQAAKRGLRIPPWLSVYVMCEVLEALTYAWELVDAKGRERRIVHRDVTPSNIFISDQGEVKLGDFGVARDDTRESQTRAGQLKGKLAYMAPEQLFSQPPDHRVDVFAAGVVLWEALAQRRLFGGRPEIEIMQAISKGARRAPSEHVSDISPGLDAIVLSAVEIDKRSRLASAQEMQGHLLEELHQMRARIRPADVRAVVATILGRPEGGHDVGSLAEARSGAGPRSSTQVSFQGIDDASGSPHALLANPDYDGDSSELLEGPPLDLAGDLDLSGDLPSPEPSDDLEGIEVEVDLGSVLPSPSPPRRHGNEPTRDAPPYAPPLAAAPVAFPPPSFSPGTASGEEVDSRFVQVAVGKPLSRPQRVGSSGALIERTLVGRPLPAPPSADALELPGVASLDPRGASRPQPAPASDEDFDMDRLVLDAVHGVEAAVPRSQVAPKESFIAGLEHRRLLDNSRQLKSERWSFILDQELYDGPHPFWVRDHEGTEIGPCSFEQALQILKVECKAELTERVSVGASREAWMPLQSFLQLAGMECLAAAPARGADLQPSWTGHTRDGSLCAVFAALTRAHANGRLFVEDERDELASRVIEISRGRPTYVWAAGHDMQIPQLLVKSRVMHARLLDRVLHRVLSEEAALGQILSREAGIDIRRYFGMLMKERLAELFRREGWRFAFDASHAPTCGTPFAKSLLAPAGELSFRAVPSDRIESRLSGLLDTSFEPSRDFVTMVGAASLKPEHIQIAEKLASGRRLGRLLEGEPSARARVIRTVAFVLLEAELLRPRGS